MTTPALDAWHDLVRRRDASALDDMLADDCVFHSPIVHTPQRGKALSKLYLTGAILLLGGEDFHYVREIVGERDAMLEFRAVVDGIEVNGVDIVRWNDAGKIVDFKVMVRPLKAIHLLHAKMAAQLEKMKALA
ncbi:steroid Delta-isomerase [Myxococcaceae bacterium]|jgi:hypothetical protein|nr:steroid Delta-isomerase [Myxococcaceae bacterium]